MSLLPFPFREDIESYYLYDNILDFIGQGAYATVYKAAALESACIAQKKEQELLSSIQAVPSSHFSEPGTHGLAGTGVHPETTSLTPGMPVALKVINKNSLVSERMYRDVVNEVEVARLIHHPNCAELYECFQTPVHVVLVMTFADGLKELFHALREDIFAEPLIQSITFQLLQALRYLHDGLGVVHRDLKPENILIGVVKGEGDGPSRVHVMLVDFGLGRLINSRSASHETVSSGCHNRFRTMSYPSHSATDVLAASASIGWKSGLPKRPSRSLCEEEEKGASFHAGKSTPSPSVPSRCLPMPPRPGTTTQSYFFPLSLNGSPAAMGNQSSSQGALPTSLSRISLEDSCISAVGDASPMETTPCGTLTYAAPETLRSVQSSIQLLTTRYLLPRVDMYAVGLIMHVMFCGRLPYGKQNGNRMGLLRAMEAGPSFDAPSWAQVSPEGLALTAALLRFDPKHRYRAAVAIRHPWFDTVRGELMQHYPIYAEEYSSSDARLARAASAPANEEEAERCAQSLVRHNTPQEDAFLEEMGCCEEFMEEEETAWRSGNGSINPGYSHFQSHEAVQGACELEEGRSPFLDGPLQDRDYLNRAMEDLQAPEVLQASVEAEGRREVTLYSPLFDPTPAGIYGAPSGTETALPSAIRNVSRCSLTNVKRSLCINSAPTSETRLSGLEEADASRSPTETCFSLKDVAKEEQEMRADDEDEMARMRKLKGGLPGESASGPADLNLTHPIQHQKNVYSFF